MLDCYTYQKETFSCEHCNWTGPGSETQMGENFRDGYEIICPVCNERLPTFISYPLIEDMLANGSEADKKQAAVINAYHEKWFASSLKDISQLPDLDADNIAFVLSEVDEDGERYVVITHMQRLIWKEIRLYEYYDRFIELGQMLKQKYGNKMIDLVPNVGGLDLYGDRLRAPGLIMAFRKNLNSPKMQVAQIDTGAPPQRKRRLRRAKPERPPGFFSVLVDAMKVAHKAWWK